MRTKKLYATEEDTRRYRFIEHINFAERYQNGDDLLEPGSSFRVKGDRAKYKFQGHVVNTRLQIEWIDCMADTGEFRSFNLDRLVPGKKRVKRTRKAR